MDYSKLHWSSDWMYSEIYGESDKEDVIVGLYSIVDFPEISMYIDTENEKILEVWVDNDDE